MAIIFAVAIVFWGLYFWARTNPLPAAIVGLVIYVALWLLDIVLAARSMTHTRSRGPGGMTSNPFNGIFIRVLIIAILIRAINAGLQHRRLLRQQMEPVPPLPVI
jgi:hypothetical protein